MACRESCTLTETGDIEETANGGDQGEDGWTGRTGRSRRSCLAILAAALAGIGLGRLAGLWIAFDIFNHFIWHLAILAAAAVIGLSLPRWRTGAALALALAGFLGISVWALTWGRDSGPEKPLAPGERALKVMSFNTWLRNRDWRAVADEVRRQNPDVAVMVEFGTEKAPLLDDLAAAYPYRAHCLNVVYCHLAIISKYPFTRSEARTRWRGPPYVRVQFGPELGGLTLFGVHTIRPPYFRSQFKQIQAMAKVLARTKGPRMVAGDFNATPASEMLRTFAETSGLKRLTFLPSWPARFGPFPQIAIDHMFVSSGVRALVRPIIGDNAGSDHYPVIDTVAVATGQGT